MRKKTKYTILDNMDEQERVELRPKFSESLQIKASYGVQIRKCKEMLDHKPTNSNSITKCYRAKI